MKNKSQLITVIADEDLPLVRMIDQVITPPIK
jgi:hypothetical protein